MTHIHREWKKKNRNTSSYKIQAKQTHGTDGPENYLISLLTIHPSEDTLLSCSTPILLFFISHAIHNNISVFVLCIV